jgi:hypothetical protein
MRLDRAFRLGSQQLPHTAARGMRPIIKSLFSQRDAPGQPNVPPRPAAATTALSQRELVRWSLLVCPDPDRSRP